MTTPLRRALAVLAVVAAANVVVFLVESLWLTPVRVPTASMAPTLRSGDRVLVNRQRGFASLHRGDLVVFRARRNAGAGTTFDGNVDRAAASGNFRGGPTELLVKRVIALPGESIEGRQHLIAIDGNIRLHEPYAHWGSDSSSFSNISINRDEIWVMGDNREHSRDSRNFGPVPRRAVVGVVALRIWPLARWGRVA